MHPFRAAVESGDLEGVADLFAEEAIFNSPVSFKPFEGKEKVLAVLRAAYGTFEDFEYTDELSAGDVHILVFRARVGDKRLQGIDLIRENSDGKIEDFTVMVRPASGLMALGEEMGKKIGHLA